MCLPRATHQVVIHLGQHTTNKYKFSRCDRASINRWFLTDSKLAEKARFTYMHLSIWKHFRDRHPDMSPTSPYTSRSSRISAPSGTPGSPSGGGVAYSGSSRTLGSPCMNAVSPSANVPSDVVDARICSVTLMDDSSGVGQLRSISWMSLSLKPCTHHLALALYPVSVSFQRRTRREEIILSPFFFSDHICLRGVYDGHRLVIEYSLPFGFDCFRELRVLFGRKVFQGYLVGVPSTEVKFSMQCAQADAIEKVQCSWLLPT